MVDSGTLLSISVSSKNVGQPIDTDNVSRLSYHKLFTIAKAIFKGMGRSPREPFTLQTNELNNCSIPEIMLIRT